MLVGSEFGGTWENPGGGFFKFAVKRPLKQDQIFHMEGKLQVIRYFSREWANMKYEGENICCWLAASFTKMQNIFQQLKFKWCPTTNFAILTSQQHFKTRSFSHDIFESGSSFEMLQIHLLFERIIMKSVKDNILK